MKAHSKRLFPVIHCISPYAKQGIGHALANATTAFAGGADGVFLIGHALPYTEVIYIYEEVRKQHPERWIGINLLDISADAEWPRLEKIAGNHPDLNALWMDQLPGVFPKTRSDLELLGGVAFKYINPDLDGPELVEACRDAMYCVDTVTTSGSKTGSPPEVSKLKVMREAIDPQARLALASGVSVENVTLFLPLVDTFLVASSITERRDDLGREEYLVLEKVSALANIIHG